MDGMRWDRKRWDADCPSPWCESVVRGVVFSSTLVLIFNRTFVLAALSPPFYSTSVYGQTVICAGAHHVMANHHTDRQTHNPVCVHLYVCKCNNLPSLPLLLLAQQNLPDWYLPCCCLWQWQWQWQLWYLLTPLSLTRCYAAPHPHSHFPLPHILIDGKDQLQVVGCSSFSRLFSSFLQNGSINKREPDVRTMPPMDLSLCCIGYVVCDVGQAPKQI